MGRGNKSLNDKMDNLLSKMDEESDKQQKWREKMTNNLKKLDGKIENVATRVKKMEDESKSINDELNRLKITVNSLEQSAFKDEVVIRGVPECERNEEDLLALTKIIVNMIQLIPEPTICLVKRLGRKSEEKTKEKTTPRTILLQLSHSSEKVNLLKKKKTVKISCDMITFEGKAIGSAQQLIYIDERLTKQTGDIYRHARIYRKNGLLKHVWIRDGQLYVRKKENTPGIRVDNLEQLDSLARKRRHNSTPIQPGNLSSMEFDTSDSSSEEEENSQAAAKSPPKKKGQRDQRQ